MAGEPREYHGPKGTANKDIATIEDVKSSPTGISEDEAMIQALIYG